MRSGRLLLLAVLCLAEIAYGYIEGYVDLDECVAARKGTNPYMCVMETDCFKPNMYVRTATDGSTIEKTATRESCNYGYSIRSLRKDTWEVTVQFNGNLWFKLEFMDDPVHGQTHQAAKPIFVLQVKNQVKTITSKPPFFARDISPASSSNYYSFVRVEVTLTNMKTYAMNNTHGYFTTAENSVDLVQSLENEGKIDIKNWIYRCDPLREFAVERAKSIPMGYQTQVPSEPVFAHNHYDFSAMCTGNYKAHHNNLRIVSIECLPPKDEAGKNAEKGQQVIVYASGKEILFNDVARDNRFIEVTCRTEYEDCMYCDANTLPVIDRPPGHKAIKFIDGDRSRISPKCPRLECDEPALFYFPEMGGMTTREAPRCIYNNTENKYQWMITQRDIDAWQRKRIPVAGGYCWKKGKCSSLPESVLACPRRPLDGFESCAEATLDATGSFKCPRGLLLHATLTRRVRLAPVASVHCNADKGEYEITLLNGGGNFRLLTDESWILCKKGPIRRKHEPNIAKMPHPMVRMLYGGALGLSVYIGLMVIALLLRFPIVWAMDFWKATEIPPEFTPEAIDARKRAAVAAATSSSKIAEHSRGGGEEAPLLRKRASPIIAVAPTRPPGSIFQPFIMPPSSSKAETQKKSDTTTTGTGTGMKTAVAKNEKDASDDKTCVEPSKSEMEILKEQERLKECTSEDDRTGKDVRPIEKEE